jgi:hypothetical protein
MVSIGPPGDVDNLYVESPRDYTRAQKIMQIHTDAIANGSAWRKVQAVALGEPMDCDDKVRNYRDKHPQYGSMPFDFDDAVRLTEEESDEL